MEILLIGHDGRDSAKARAERLISAAPKLFGPAERARIWQGSTAVVALVDDGVDPTWPIWHVAGSGSRIALGLAHHRDTAERLPACRDAMMSFGNDDSALLIEVDDVGGTIEIRNDGVGAASAFVAEAGSELLVSTSLHLLAYLGLKIEFDLLGVASYLGSEHPVGGRTIYAGARLLEPGAIWCWRRSAGLTKAGRWLLSRESRPRETPPDQLVERFAQTWPNVMERMLQRTSGAPAVSLSGGLDSRSVAGGLANAGADPICFTYGSIDDREVQVAKRVSDFLGFRHLTLPVRPANRLQHAEFCLNALDGSHSPFRMYEGWFKDDLAPIGNGIVNGSTANSFWGSCPAAGLASRDEVVAYTLKEFLREFIPVSEFLDADFARQARGLLAAVVAESIDAVGDPDIPDLGTLWKLRNRERTWLWSQKAGLRRAGLRLEDPFQYRDFIEFAKLVPGTMRQNGRLYLEVYRRCFPALAAFPRSTDAFPPKLMSDHLYRATMGQRLAQLAAISARNPRAAAVGGGFLATAYAYWLAGRAIIPESVARPVRRTLQRHNPVFKHRDWLHGDPIYQSRYLALLEEAIGCVPAFVDSRRLAATQDEIASGRLAFNPLLLGRIIAICLWKRIADRHRATGAGIERG